MDGDAGSSPAGPPAMGRSLMPRRRTRQQARSGVKHRCSTCRDVGYVILGLGRRDPNRRAVWCPDCRNRIGRNRGPKRKVTQ